MVAVESDDLSSVFDFVSHAAALRFVAQQLPARYDARFKDLREREGALERRYAFEADAVEKALKQWGAENGFEILD